MRTFLAWKQKRKAFTLIEVVVVIGITAILMAMSLGYNRDSERQIILFSEQAKVAGILERAKNLALTKYKSGDTEFCGIGVYFDTSNVFTIFGDKVVVQGGECNGKDDGDIVIESQPLDGRLFVEIVATGGSIIFKPPYGEVVLSNALTPSSLPVDIVLRDRKINNNTASIEVGEGGGVTMK